MNILALAVETVKQPASAARILLAMQLPRDVIWTGFALSLVMSVFLYVLPDAIFGFSTRPAMFDFSLTTVAAVAAGLQVTLTAAVVLIGRWMGGTAQFLQILGLMVWVRLVNITAQAIGFAMFFISAPMSAAFNIAAVVYGAYVLAHFVNEGLGLGSVVKSFGVLVMAFIGSLLCIAFFLGLFVPSLMETVHV